MQKLTLFLILLFFSTSIFSQDGFTVDIDSALVRGDEYVAKFQYNKAIPLYYECVRSDKTNVHYLNKLAYCYYQLGTNGDSKLYYQQTLKYDSTNITAHIYLGALAERESELSTASSYYGRLIEIDSTVAHYHKLKAKVDLKKGDILNGFYGYSKAIQLNPTDIETIAEVAKIYLQQNDLKSANQMLQSGRQINPRNKTINYLQVNVDFKRDSFHLVIPIMEEILEQGDTVNHYEKLLAMSYMSVGRYEDARIHLLRLTENEKPNELTYYRLAQTYDHLDSTAQSIQAYEQAIDIGISKNVSAYYKNVGILKEDLHQLKAAMNAYKEAYHFSNRADDLFHLARCQDKYYADKKIALNNYEKFLKHKGEKPDELVQYAESRIPILKTEVFQRGG